MRKKLVLLVTVIVAINTLGWYLLSRPVSLPDWQGSVRGFSFSPYAEGQNPLEKKYPSRKDMIRDLDRLAGLTSRVRTYSSSDGLENIPRLASEKGFSVTAGAWLDRDVYKNNLEIQHLIDNARQGFGIERLLVGNETLLRGDLSVPLLKAYLAEVRAATDLPVSTAEPWHVWIKHPELANAVDYITIHVLPYWEGVPVSEAPQWAMDRYHQVQKAFPNKKVLIGEVGWPSAGPVFEHSVPSAVNQARFASDWRMPNRWIIS